MPTTSVTAVVERRHIETADLEPLLEFFRTHGILEPKTAEVAILNHLRSKIEIMVKGYEKGYDDAPCAEFEIPEVRVFYKKLHAVWSHGFYFLNPTTFQNFFFANVDARIERDSQHADARCQIIGQPNPEFVKSALLPVFPIAEKLGWTFQQGLDFINEKGKPFGICMNCAEAEPSRKSKAMNAESRSNASGGRGVRRKPLPHKVG